MFTDHDRRRPKGGSFLNFMTPLGHLSPTITRMRTVKNMPFNSHSSQPHQGVSGDELWEQMFRFESVMCFEAARNVCHSILTIYMYINIHVYLRRIW